MNLRAEGALDAEQGVPDSQSSGHSWELCAGFPHLASLG